MPASMRFAPLRKVYCQSRPLGSSYSVAHHDEVVFLVGDRVVPKQWVGLSRISLNLGKKESRTGSLREAGFAQAFGSA